MEKSITAKTRIVTSGIALTLLAYASALSASASEPSPQLFDSTLKTLAVFENGSANLWGVVTPNIGSNLLSCGVLQWSFADRSLQPLVKKAGKRTVLKYMPIHGEEFWKACTTRSSEEANSIVLNWQNGPDVVSDNTSPKPVAEWKPESQGVRQELSSLFSGAELRKLQLEFARQEGRSAWKDAEHWARDTRGSQASPDTAEFGVFFNLKVMARGGSLPNFGDVKRLKQSRAFKSSPDIAFDWLLESALPMRQSDEAHRNSEIWRQTMPSSRRDLFLLAYIASKRLDRNNGTFQAVDLNRSGVFASGSGWVNGAKMAINGWSSSSSSNPVVLGHIPGLNTPGARTPFPNDFFLKALAITAQLETSHSIKSDESWGAVADDFDGGGLSCGLLQWNMKSGTLQPLVVAIGKDAVLQSMPKYGSQFWNACTSLDKQEARKIVLSWQSGNRRSSGSDGNGGALKPDVYSELQTLFRSDRMKQIQADRAQSFARSAWDYAVSWLKDQRGENEKPTVKEFAVFYDTFVHLGGMRIAGEGSTGKKILGFADVQAFKSGRRREEVVAEICDWLRDVSEPMLQVSEAHYNSEIFRQRLSSNDIDLFILCYLRAIKSNSAGGRAKALALCRRGAILVDEGKVNQTNFHFATILSNPLSLNSTQ